MSKRVLYAPRNISGQATEYRDSLRRQGWQAEVWSFGEPAFGFDVDRVFDQERLLTDATARWNVLDEAVRRFDVFHFQYSRSLLNPRSPALPPLYDLPLLASLGKQVFMHFRGSDVRSRTRHVAAEPDSYFREASLDPDEELIAARVSFCRRYCDALLVSTPGLLDDVPDAQWIPHVLDVAAWARPTDGEEPAAPLVVHLPSSRATKGSEHVDRVMEGLVEEGVCAYESPVGLDRDAVRSLLQRADIVIDGLTIGDHGLLSVEAMAAGAVAVAHIADENRRRNPGVPVVEATKATLEEVIRVLAKDPTERQQLRAKGRQWVRARHDWSIVGATLIDLYDQPTRRRDLSHPDWPVTDSDKHQRALEAELERLRADVKPSLRGLSPVRRHLPKIVVDRLLARIIELEAALREAAPDSPRLEEGTVPKSQRAGIVARLERRPRMHRAARRVAKSLRGGPWRRS